MEVSASRTPAQRKALFVTFYSFKGGVGRTMALLNTAAILAGLGRRVLMVDFDLEAPGLTLFQDRQRGPGTVHQQRGLVDALSDFLDDPEGAPLARNDPDRFFEAYVAELDVPPALQKIGGGRLDLLPTGQLDNEYERRLYGLPFGELFEGGVGVPMFAHLKGLIRDSDRYDYVLIDSRTGFSDEGSICTRYLADDLVVVTGLNYQNLQGTARFLKQSGLAAREGPPNRIGFVASPVPVFYEELVAERTAEAQEMLLDAGLAEARFIAEIPYHPILALDEDPRVHDLSETPLYGAYREIESMIRSWAGDLPRARMTRALDLLQRGDGGGALRIIREVRQEDPHLVLSMLPAAVDPFDDYGPAAVLPVLEEWLDIARTHGDSYDVMWALERMGSAHSLKGDAEMSARHYEEASSMAREVSDRPLEGVYLGNVGNQMADLGRVGEAIGYYEEALSTAREVADHWNEGVWLNNLGVLTTHLGRAGEAVAYYEEALSIAREVGDRRNEGVSLGNLGVALAMLGRDTEARNTLAHARRIAEDLNNLLPLRAGLMIDEVEALALIESREALTLADEVWDAVINDAAAFERARAQVLRARLRAEHGDRMGAVEDASAALDLYHSQDVDSRWSREAEAILEKLGSDV